MFLAKFKVSKNAPCRSMLDDPTRCYNIKETHSHGSWFVLNERLSLVPIRGQQQKDMSNNIGEEFKNHHVEQLFATCNLVELSISVNIRKE